MQVVSNKNLNAVEDNSKPNYKLIIDERERKIHAFTNILKDIDYEVKTINVGDYSLYRQTGDQIKVIAQFERKTLEDFAASFKDGRAMNKEKLITFREETGCKIIYIIEGEHETSPDTYYGNIAYKNIESSIFHLMVRDNFNVIWSKNQLDTASILVRFVQSMITLDAKGPLGGQQKKECEGARENKGESEGLCEKTLTEEELKAKYKVKKAYTDMEILTAMWAKLPGITTENAADYMKHITLQQLFKKEADLTLIRKNGKPLTKATLTKMANIPSDKVAKILSEVPGISKETATFIVASNGHLLPAKDLAEITPNKTKIGLTKAELIIKLLNLKI